jgi:hypothetical protein
VIQDHLRLERRLALGGLALLDQAARLEPRIGVALQVAGGPRQVDQQAAQDVVAVGACRGGGLRGAAQAGNCWQMGAGR